MNKGGKKLINKKGFTSFDEDGNRNGNKQYLW